MVGVGVASASKAFAPGHVFFFKLLENNKRVMHMFNLNKF